MRKEKIVIKTKLALIFTLWLLCSILPKASSLYAQTIEPPQFLDSLGNVASAQALFGAVGEIDSKLIHSLPTCQAGLGIFSFEVTDKGIVDIVNFSGNLPKEVIAKVKQNILKTSGRWKPQIQAGEAVNSLPFIFICNINVMDCSSMPVYQNNEYLMGFMLEKAITSRDMKRTITRLDNAYLLPVGGFSLMR